MEDDDVLLLSLSVRFLVTSFVRSIFPKKFVSFAGRLVVVSTRGTDGLEAILLKSDFFWLSIPVMPFTKFFIFSIVELV